MSLRIAAVFSLMLWWTAGHAQNISNKGKEFWVGYGHHQFMEDGSNTQEMTIYLSAEDQPATVTVTIDRSGPSPATWWRRTYNIPAFTVISIETTAANSFSPQAGPIGAIPKGQPGKWDARLFTFAPPAGTGGAGLFASGKGIHIESTAPIVAYAHIYGSASSGATMLLPVEAWGYSYVSLNSNQDYQSNCYSWMYVVAKEDNTLIEIIPSVKTRAQNLTGLQQGVARQITLNKGQIYQVIGANTGSDANGNGGTSSSGYQLTGTVVNALNCKPIAVFAGSSRTDNAINCGSGGGDNDNQQLFPEHSWGKRYLTAPFSGSPATSFATSNYKVAVKDPNTVVKRNGVQLTGLQNGNYYVFESSTADFIEADKPITVAQYMTGGGCIPGSWGDPEMVILSPIEQATKRTGFYRNTDQSINLNYLTLVVPNGGTGLSSLRIDGQGPASFTHTYTHPNNPRYTVVIKQWPAAKAQCLVRGDSAFTAITYGIGSVESYAYNAGAQLNDLRAIKHIHNVYDSVNTSNLFTCRNTPIRLSALIAFQPTKITWKLDTLALPVTPNTRVVQNAPTPVGTEVINGETYYRYELPGEYKFTQAGTFFIPIETEEPSALCARKDQMFLEIVVNDAPTADFSFTQTGCQSNVFNFTSPATSANGYTIKNWWWDFGNGAKDSISQNPTQTYTAEGTYNVHLSVVSQEGCIGEVTKPITLANITVNASIVASPENVCEGGSITFTDTTATTTGITSWYWDFGNGQTITETTKNPHTITYATPGTYEVIHVANQQNSGACGADTIRKTITVYAKPAKPVAASITYCQNSAVSALTATALAGNTLNWYTAYPLTGGSATAPTPSTATAGTFTFYVTQTNAEGCESDTAKIEVIVTPSITNNSISANQTVCSGSPAATLTGSTPTGGTGTYTYQWQQSTNSGTTWTDITGATNATLDPGVLSTGTTMFRRVVISGLCSDTSSAVSILVETNLSNYDISASQTICEGTAPALLDGQTPAGGTGTYTYQWERSSDGVTWVAIPGATSEDFQPGVLSARTHFRRITSGGNCPAISSVVIININPTANGSISGPASICQYDAGDISFTATAGSAPYTIELLITNPAGVTTTRTETVATNGPVTFNIIPANSAPGNYTVQLSSVSDNGSCIRTTGLNTLTISVTATPSLVFNPVTPTICAGSSINLNVTGAATYNWTPATGLSATTGATVTANPAATTTYTVVGAIAGCEGTGTVTVTVNDLPVKPVATSPVIYCQNATATALSATALPGHTLTWYNAFPLSGGSATAPVPSTATAGTFYYYVTQRNNATNCVSDTARIAVVVTAVIGNNTISNTQTVCTGAPASPLIGNTLTGGTGVYAYQWQQSTDGGATWTDIAGATTDTYDPGVLPTGTTQFRRVVTSGTCNSPSNAVSVIVETSLTNYEIGSAQTICEGSTPAILDGQTPSGGTGTYTYVWESSSNGSSWTAIPGATNEDYQPGALTATTHFRRTTSGGNCPAISVPVVITVNPLPNGVITAPTGICTYETADVTFTSSAGTLPYQLQLAVTAPGGGTSTINQTINTAGPVSFNVIPLNSPAGTYTVQLVSITDNNGCTRSAGLSAVNIVVTAQPVVSIIPGSDPICEGGQTQLTASGATDFTWSPSTGLSAATGASVTANPTVTTSYVVTGTTNGCSNTATIDVTVIPRPAKPAVTASVMYCQDATATQLGATALAGHTLTWYDNAALTNGTTTAPVPSTVVAGTTYYYVTQTNSNGCVSEPEMITVNINPLPVVAFDLPAGVCMPNGEARFINKTSIPGNTALTYSWDFGDGSPAVTTKDASHVYAASGNYNVTLTVTSASGCVNAYTQPFNAFYEKPDARFTVNPGILCQGRDNVFTDQSDARGGRITKWEWSFGDGQTATSQSPKHRYANPGDYEVRLVVTTEIGCVSDTFSDSVKVYLQPKIDAGPSFVVPEGTTVQFKATANDTVSVNLSWSPAAGLSDATSLQPTTTVFQNQTYTLTAVGQGNCTAIDNLTVRILKPIDVPNAFSPNGDGINDKWFIPNLADYPGAKVEVYNRWGQQVFLSYGYNTPWDGSYLGQPLPLATYYYVITLNNGFKPVTGSVTIVK